MAQTEIITKKVTQSSSLENENSYTTKKFIFRIYQIIWYILGIIEFLLAFRILLKLFGANPQSPFAQIIYNFSDPFATPFSDLFGSTVTNSSVLEWSSIIAMVVYSIIAFALVKLVQLVNPANPQKVEEKVDEQ